MGDGDRSADGGLVFEGDVEKCTASGGGGGGEPSTSGWASGSVAVLGR